ncbi:hypothetical protein [Halocalculus aciditolerans]|uniref:Uncharacterized protein n=1 Tax=Halocalculus aciditolerans TaxID=1383812 RepID=A0A830FLF8_9EURY|nr:hypothetical protein [Halocalculus aciditolerans]GGL64269.1 hypothetical protein GCM10009039_22660 [Halocalculus aciditolerans]
MSLIDRLDKSDDDSLPDEAILNVMRRGDEKVLTTAEIARELPITQDWTGKRLNKLETNGRVHSKSAGQGRVWWLDEAEPASHVAEHIGDLMWYASTADQSAGNIWIMSVGMFIVSGLLLIPILLLGLFPALSAIPFTTTDFATGAMLGAVGGALFLIGGSILKLASLWLTRRYTTVLE